MAQKIGKISSSQSHPSRHCYHWAKKTKMLVARMLCFFSFPPLFICSFSYLREKLGARMWSGHGFLRLCSRISYCLPSQPSQASSPHAADPLPGDAGAQVHVRQPLLLPRLRALLPGPDRWAASLSLLGTHVCTWALQWFCELINSGFSPSSARVHAVPAEWKVRQRRQNVQQVDICASHSTF